MKKVLISGGAGFIGSKLALRLIATGHEVAILDNLSPQIHGENPEHSQLYREVSESCEFFNGDVRSREAWREVLYGRDTVVHLAAETGTGQSMYEIDRYTSVNIGGTALLLDILGDPKQSIERLLVASSRAIYGEGKYNCQVHGISHPRARMISDSELKSFDPPCPVCGHPMEPVATDESSPLSPTSIYGITKQVQEQLALMFGTMTGMPVSALRFQNVYGPGQSLRNPYTGILSIFSTTLRRGNPINIFEDGLESRDFVYIDDVVNAIIAALKLDKGTECAINVGSGKPTTVLEVASVLKTLYNSSSPIQISGQYRIGDIRHNYADITIAKAKLGFEPTVDFQTGIRKFSKWVQSQELPLDTYATSLTELSSKGLLK